MNWKCRQCQATLEIPDGVTMKFCPHCGAKAEMSSVPADSSPKSAQTESSICPVCCAPIQPGDDCIVCPDCKMAYHQDCWNDNNGCATYGCSSAGCLNPAPLKIDVAELGGGKPGETVCPHCGVSLAAGATFCWSCSRDLTAKVKTVQKQSSKYEKAVSLLGVTALVTMLDLVFFLFFHKSWFSYLSPSILLILRDDLKIFFGAFFFIINVSLWYIARKYLCGLIIATVLCSLDVLLCLFTPLRELIFPLVVHLLLVIIFSNGIYAQLMMRKKGCQ